MDEDWINLMNTLNCGAMMAAMEMDAEFEKKERKKARYWVSPYLKERNDKGRFMSDFEALRNSPNLFVENFRMPPQVFDELCVMVEPHLLPKRNTRPKDLFQLKPNWQWYYSMF
ncbi:uncharacterized protein LOC126765763 [Bactrocera neohumeralis]|uniref:uncharacterized protein LOC126765763 n=1 Tax=Bactrocera neohumeralis TaxID=98809 RepID=UPI002165D1E0|nr:uncharacterized protein LOC126765763 [Bactrocera neohumeralis]